MENRHHHRQDTTDKQTVEYLILDRFLFVDITLLQIPIVHGSGAYHDSMTEPETDTVAGDAAPAAEAGTLGHGRRRNTEPTVHHVERLVQLSTDTDTSDGSKSGPDTANNGGPPCKTSIC